MKFIYKSVDQTMKIILRIKASSFYVETSTSDWNNC